MKTQNKTARNLLTALAAAMLISFASCSTDGGGGGTHKSFSSSSSDAANSSSSVVETSCGNGWYDASNANFRCLNNVIETRCGTDGWYNTSTQFCYTDNTVRNKCNRNDYNPATQYCSKGRVGIHGDFEADETLENYDFVTHENKTYKTVVIVIGRFGFYQIWMAENLNYNANGSVCYDKQESNCAKYGRLYDWATAMALDPSCNSSSCASQISEPHRGICPPGWHIPNDHDWDFFAGICKNTCSNTQAPFLKALSGWDGCSDEYCKGTDAYGFEALPGGNGSSDGNFGNVRHAAYWWSASENDDSKASSRYIQSIFVNLVSVQFDKSSLLSVRCLKD